MEIDENSKSPAKRAEIKNDDVCVSDLQKIKGKWTIFNRKRGQEDNDILIIGDSIVGGICANGVDIFAINRGRTTDVISCLYLLPLVKYKTIALMIGGKSSRNNHSCGQRTSVWTWYNSSRSYLQLSTNLCWAFLPGVSTTQNFLRTW